MCLISVRLLLVFLISVFPAKTQYNVDIIDVEWTDKTKSRFEMKWEISRPSRGIYTVSGIVDIKEDLDTDNSWTFVNVYYSANGISYMLSPYRVPRTKITDALNIGFKTYFMETSKECCENTVYFEETFTSPLTKRRVVCKNCLYPNDTLPSYMRKGYYRIEVVFQGAIESEVKFLNYLEPE